MYNLKRIIQDIADIRVKENSADRIDKLTGEALTEIDHLEQIEKDDPQEMRDVFAAAALIGVVMAEGQSTSQARMDMVREAWSISDLMMFQRAKRIEGRKCNG